MSKVQYYINDTVTSSKRLWVNYTDDDLHSERWTQVPFWQQDGKC